MVDTMTPASPPPTYESAVLIPVSTYLDAAACVVASSAATSVDALHTKADAVASIVSSLSLALTPTGGGTGDGSADGSADGSTHGGSNGVPTLYYWSQFLHADSGDGGGDGIDGSGGSSPESEIRDELLDCLVSSCSEYENEYSTCTNDEYDDVNVFEAAMTLRNMAFECLAHIVAVRNTFGAEKGRTQHRECSLVGSRLANLAPSILSALSGPTRRQQAATNLVRNLLPPKCPRDECPPAHLRDLVLVPLSSSDVAAAVASDMLRQCIVDSTTQATQSVRTEGVDPIQLEEMRGLKVESATLGRLQEMRPVLDNLLPHILDEEGKSEGGRGEEEGEVLLRNLRVIYDLAPVALESQLDGKGGSDVLAMLRGDDDDLSKDGGNVQNDDESNNQENENDQENGGANHPTTLLPPFYHNLSAPPIPSVGLTPAQLRAELATLSASLSESNPEMWNVRLTSLETLERMLAGGLVRHDPELRSVFMTTIRKMDVERQILDLRSQITRQACRVITCLAYEIRDVVEKAADYEIQEQQGQGQSGTDCAATMATLVEVWVPSVLKLCISGVRLMAMQGINCLLHLSALGGTYGYPRVVPTLCDGCVGKKVHQNHRRGCILSLTTALRVWGVHCLEKHSDAIVKAVSESASHRDPSVREEGRKAFWALHEREEFRHLADGLLGKMDARERKRLTAAKGAVDAEWAPGGRMEVLVRTGVDQGSLPPKGGSSSSRTSGPNKSSRPSGSRPSLRSNKTTATTGRSRLTGSSIPRQSGGGTKAAGRVNAAGRPFGAASSALPSSSSKGGGRAERTPRKPAVPVQARRGASAIPTATTPGSARKSSARRNPPSSAAAQPSPARGAKYGGTPSSRSRTSNVDDFLQMAWDAQWSQREKAFVTVSSLLERDLVADDATSIGLDVASFTATPAITRRFVTRLLDGMADRNVRVCRAAVQCCHISLRHPQLGIALVSSAESLSKILPAVLNLLGKYDGKGTGTVKLHGSALGCLRAVMSERTRDSTVRMFTTVLEGHNNAAAGEGDAAAATYQILSEGGMRYLIDTLRGALSDEVGAGDSTVDGVASPSALPAEDVTCLLTQLAAVLPRLSDDRLGNVVCRLLRLLLGGNDLDDVERTIQVLLNMDREDVDVLVECIWTYGGQWGEELREGVVSALEGGALSSNGGNGETENMAENAFLGGEFADKSSADQADLFSDLLSPPPGKSNNGRTPEAGSKPMRSLTGEMNTPKTPAIPDSIRSRLLDDPGQHAPSPADASTQMAETSAAAEIKCVASSDNETCKAKTPAPKTTIERDENRYTPYQSALRSLRKKSKTPMLELTPPPTSAEDAAPGTDAVMRYMARPSPLSPLVARQLSEFGDSSNVLPGIVAGLSRSGAPPQEQYLMLQALLQYAKENGADAQWKGEFPAILECLLAGSAPPQGEGRNVEPLSPLPLNNQGATSTDAKGQPFSPSVTASASRHLFLQGLRALIKYVPTYFDNHIDEVVDKLLQCSQCSTYEIVHTAERALENLAERVDPLRCLNALTSHLQESAGGGKDSGDSAMVLLTLRSLCKLMNRIPRQDMLDALPVLKPAIYSSLNDRAVDMRKAGVFVIVEMYFVLGDELMSELGDLNAAQHKLVSIYIEKKKS